MPGYCVNAALAMTSPVAVHGWFHAFTIFPSPNQAFSGYSSIKQSRLVYIKTDFMVGILVPNSEFRNTKPWRL